MHTNTLKLDLVVVNFDKKAFVPTLKLSSII